MGAALRGELQTLRPGLEDSDFERTMERCVMTTMRVRLTRRGR
jgi:hypothetical protein